MNWNFKIFDSLISKKINSSEIKLKSLSYFISIDNCDSFNIGSLSSFKKGSLKINGYSCVVCIKNDNSGSQARCNKRTGSRPSCWNKKDWDVFFLEYCKRVSCQE